MTHKEQCKAQIASRLTGYVASHRRKATAWGKAKALTRKDGTEFARLTQASFENCTLTTEDAVRPRIKVFFDDGGRYVWDDLPAFGEVNHEHPHVYGYDYPTVLTDPNTSHQINERIQAKVAHENRMADELEKQLAKLDMAFDPFYDTVLDAIGNLIGVCGADDNSLFYACREFVLKDDYGMTRIAKAVRQ